MPDDAPQRKHVWVTREGHTQESCVYCTVWKYAAANYCLKAPLDTRPGPNVFDRPFNRTAFEKMRG